MLFWSPLPNIAIKNIFITNLWLPMKIYFVSVAISFSKSANLCKVKKPLFHYFHFFWINESSITKFASTRLWTTNYQFRLCVLLFLILCVLLYVWSFHLSKCFPVGKVKLVLTLLEGSNPTRVVQWKNHPKSTFAKISFMAQYSYIRYFWIIRSYTQTNISIITYRFELIKEQLLKQTIDFNFS